jgi:hypothetical protein
MHRGAYFENSYISYIKFLLIDYMKLSNREFALGRQNTSVIQMEKHPSVRSTAPTQDARYYPL